MPILKNICKQFFLSFIVLFWARALEGQFFLTLLCQVSTKRLHIRKQTAPFSCSFVEVCVTFKWTPGTEGSVVQNKRKTKIKPTK